MTQQPESTPVERVQEYLRQRKWQTRDLGNVIHNTHTDVNADMASLTIDDLEAALADAWAEGVQNTANRNALPEAETAQMLEDNPYRPKQ